MTKQQDNQDIDIIESVCDSAIFDVTDGITKYAGVIIDERAQAIMEQEFSYHHERFIGAIMRAETLARRAKAGVGPVATDRISSINPRVSDALATIHHGFPVAADAWVIGGLLFKSQTAGIKTIIGCTDDEADIIDSFNSASSVALGAENPWLVQADRIEDYLGIRDNVCIAYHPSVRQGYAMQELIKLYPGGTPKDQIAVHMEGSGSIAATIAIESVVPYVEQREGKPNMMRVLAIDGTWAGSYGAAREATGFGVDEGQTRRAGSRQWADRCLPAPTAENADEFIRVITQKLAQGTVAGIYIEPDIIGDIGIIAVEKPLLRKVRQIMEAHNLPIIIDCVQQLGRTGSYWGENVDTILHGYPLLVTVTAKSAANGQPFAFTLMPKEIADAAQPISQITTNQMNGPLLRAVTTARIMSDPAFQQWIAFKTDKMNKAIECSGASTTEVRGKYFNRSFVVGTNEEVKLAQLSLLIQDGILVGALPNALRYQPNMLDLTTTNTLVVETILNRIAELKKGNVHAAVERIYTMQSGAVSGLARESVVATDYALGRA
jgi:acetylornithine/succinyldiaminopimelate/putrescine aminotransferase